MSRCRCGHEDTEHPPFHPAFETQHCTGECTRCDCPYFHATTYKKHITALRTAARNLRGQPLQPQLFREDTAPATAKTGDPADVLAAENKEATPCNSER